MRYRRNYLSAGTYFITIVLEDRKSRLLLDNIHVLREAFQYVKNRHPFCIDAYVVLPDHLHMLITVPDENYSERIKLIKSYFSRNITRFENISKSRMSKQERGIWQRRFWEHTIRDDKDFAYHVYYIHDNPVKHSYVNNANEWEYSSIHHYLKAGKLKGDLSATWS